MIETFFYSHAIFLSDLQESNDHHFSRVDEGFNIFGVIQSRKGAV